MLGICGKGLFKHEYVHIKGFGWSNQVGKLRTNSAKYCIFLKCREITMRLFIIPYTSIKFLKSGIIMIRGS